MPSRKRTQGEEPARSQERTKDRANPEQQKRTAGEERERERERGDEAHRQRDPYFVRVPKIQYRFLKWRINRSRKRFDVYNGGRADDVDRRVH